MGSIPQQPDSASQEPIDHLQVGFEHTYSLLDDVELGLGPEILKADLQAIDRVRGNLSAEENAALSILQANEIKQRSEGVQRQAILLLQLKENYEELSELADAMGVLPNGATWAEMQERIGPIAWAWKPWLPEGMLTLVASEPGQGKSMLLLRIAACFLRGDPWPDGQPFAGDTGAVLWCEAEAAQALNLERAKAWNLPLERIYTPLDDPLADVQLDIEEHQQVVRTMANRPDVRLVVVDSLRGVHRGDENSSTSMEIVKWLAELARDAGKLVMLSHHLRKKGILDLDDKVGLDRVRGSSAIIQTARLVWAIDRPDLESDVRRLSVIKNNLARFPEPVGLSIGDLGMSFGDAPEAPRQESQLDKAIDLLRVLLDTGPVPSSELEEEAKGAGLSWRTMVRAKKKLGVIDKRAKIGEVNNKPKFAYVWALPARDELLN